MIENNFIYLLLMEIWKDIVGYEGLYQVSSTGSIKTVGHNKNKYHPKIEKIRSASLRGAYLSVVLCKNGKIKNIVIHRLVAKSFIENPQNKPQVNHINGIKTDNRVENLEWVTQVENQIHAIKNGLQVIKRKDGSLARPISLFDRYLIKKEYAKKNKNQTEIAAEFGSTQSNISRIIKNQKACQH